MNILTIGGSDPSSGAGIQSDIKTFEALHVYGLSVITALTSQNTFKFSKVFPISPEMIKNQFDTILSDFKIDAIKISMVFNYENIKAIHLKLKNLSHPIIIDPVIKSTTGGILLKKNALGYLKKLLFPLATVVTPNVYEAEKLTGTLIKSKKDLLLCANKIKSFGAKNVIITGSKVVKKKVSDFILEDSKTHIISGKEILKNNHGSGCNYSAALTVGLASKKNLYDAAKFANHFSVNSINNSKQIGKGISITELKKDKLKKSLADGILCFGQIKNIHTIIPECQTNFVNSIPKPRSIKDILGVSGRIVKSGSSLIVAGNLEYGGSKHVGSAILQMSKKYPQLRSGVNIKYDTKLIQKFKKTGLEIASYDREKEPGLVKTNENKSIKWGIKTATKNLKKPPDLVFHKGDLGKEPMIIVFGKNPSDVVKKISRILC